MTQEGRKYAADQLRELADRIEADENMNVELSFSYGHDTVYQLGKCIADRMDYNRTQTIVVKINGGAKNHEYVDAYGMRMPT